MSYSTTLNNATATDLAFEYPILRVPTRWYEDETPPGTMLRNVPFLLGHSGFLMFNLINIFYILVFHGYVLRRLKNNFLMKMALLACIVQVFSCLCSIHRYNINDEFGLWAHYSNAFGLSAFAILNFIILHIFLNANRNKYFHFNPFDMELFEKLKVGYVTVGATIWTALAMAAWTIGRINWEMEDFKFFRIYISLSTAHQLLSYILVLRAVHKGKVGLPEDFPVSNEILKRVLISAIGLVLLAIGGASTAMPVFQYPATGLTYTVMVIVVSFVGEMDFMIDEDPAERRTNKDDLDEQHALFVV